MNVEHIPTHENSVEKRYCDPAMIFSATGTANGASASAELMERGGELEIASLTSGT